MNVGEWFSSFFGCATIKLFQYVFFFFSFFIILLLKYLVVVVILIIWWKEVELKRNGEYENRNNKSFANDMMRKANKKMKFAHNKLWYIEKLIWMLRVDSWALPSFIEVFYFHHILWLPVRSHFLSKRCAWVWVCVFRKFTVSHVPFVIVIERRKEEGEEKETNWKRFPRSNSLSFHFKRRIYLNETP